MKKTLKFNNDEFEIETKSEFSLVKDMFDLDNRIINIVGEVCEQSVSYYCMALKLMLLRDAKAPIDIFINSGGGSVHDGLALYDLLVEAPCKIRTHVIGKAMSMATILFLAGKERDMTTNSVIMVHTVSSSTSGKIADTENDIAEARRLNEILLGIVASRTKKNKKWWSKMVNKDYYITKTEAKQLGMINK